MVSSPVKAGAVKFDLTGFGKRAEIEEWVDDKFAVPDAKTGLIV